MKNALPAILASRNGRHLLTAGALILIVTTLVLLRLVFDGLPALPAAADKTGPDPALLLRHVQALAAAPRPSGSAEHERARAYLLTELNTLGVETMTQDAAALNSWFEGYHTAGRVRNVIARIPGNPGVDAVLIISHYDSVETGPGAGDSAAGVAGLLEAVRLCRNGSAPRNDIIFLFADGEEDGLHGAKVFAERHPLMAKVRAVCNFDARGARGPTRLFETGPQSGGLVRSYLAAASSPAGTSLANDVYALVPNNTDFSIFRQNGVPGLNFAFIGDYPVYHTRLDAPERLDPRTLHHQATNILACASHFGNVDLRAPAGDDEIYFPIIGSAMVRYPVGAAPVLAVVTLLLLALLLTFAFLRKQISPWKSLAAAGAFVLAAAVSGALVSVLSRLLGALHPDFGVLTEPYSAGYFRIVFSLVPLLPAGALGLVFKGRISAREALAGASLLFAPFLAAAVILFPRSSFLFQWPLFFAILILGSLLFGKRVNLPWTLKQAGVVLLCVPAVFLAVDIFNLTFEGLTLSLAFIPVIFISLFYALLRPLGGLPAGKGKIVLPAAAGAVGLAALVIGLASVSFNTAQPRPETMTYALDADRHQASWIACDSPPSRWSGEFFKADASLSPLPEFFPMVRGCLFQPSGFRHTPAPALPLDAPLLSLVSDRRLSSDGREIVLRFRSPRLARRAALIFKRESGAAEIVVDGNKLQPNPAEGLRIAYRLILDQFDYKNWTVVMYTALPAEGIEVRITSAGSGPVTIRAIDLSDDPPDPERTGYRNRPPESMPAQNRLLPSGVLVEKAYRF
jgi:hypothetical protein